VWTATGSGAAAACFWGYLRGCLLEQIPCFSLTLGTWLLSRGGISSRDQERRILNVTLEEGSFLGSFNYGHSKRYWLEGYVLILFHWNWLVRIV
jgi:hypothetical protein